LRSGEKETKLGLIKKAFNEMTDLPKKMLKYAMPAVMSLLIIGTILFVQSKITIDYSAYAEFSARTLIINSFFVLCEFLIAAFVMDIVIRKSRSN
jgi:hypothetical protein